MSDLVERLRNHREYQSGNVPANWHPLICTEAADALEAKDRRIAELEDQPGRAHMDAVQTRTIDPLRAENERLRAVYEAAKNYYEKTPFTNYADCVALHEALAAVEEASDENT